MDLWIRSQNKEMLTKVNMVDLASDSDLEIVCVFDRDDYTLGKYKTKERALEVLDEIEKYLTPTIQMLDVTLKDKQVVQVNSISTFVYEMPQE